ncbi:unnamed protein product [Brachionus calyciflorus]|uniref:Apple domain-containing protein n=1 Tax=Brachionus calyciflorus TaxID=104777 RepID=A0A813VUY3_9BILA|nr:unnamed protein product [Brachionus calyciflorus]
MFLNFRPLLIFILILSKNSYGISKLYTRINGFKLQYDLVLETINTNERLVCLSKCNLVQKCHGVYFNGKKCDLFKNETDFDSENYLEINHELWTSELTEDDYSVEMDSLNEDESKGILGSSCEQDHDCLGYTIEGNHSIYRTVKCFENICKCNPPYAKPNLSPYRCFKNQNDECLESIECIGHCIDEKCDNNENC